MTSANTSTLSVIQTIKEFKRVPLDFLAHRLGRSETDINASVKQLAAKGILKIESGVVTIAAPDQAKQAANSE